MESTDLEKVLAEAYTISDLANLFGVSRITIDYWRRAHALPVLKAPSKFYIVVPADKLADWVEEKQYKLPSVANYVLRRRQQARQQRVPTRLREAAKEAPRERLRETLGRNRERESLAS